ncbi:MAG: hypothetical protein WDM87_00460 [Terracidiphilus sp.]
MAPQVHRPESGPPPDATNQDRPAFEKSGSLKISPGKLSRAELFGRRFKGHVWLVEGHAVHDDVAAGDAKPVAGERLTHSLDQHWRLGVVEDDDVAAPKQG